MKFIDIFDKKTWKPNWDKVFSIAEFEDMRTCKQSQEWHKEGNVDTHTKLVAEAMYVYLTNKLCVKPSNDPYYIMMMSAAICHDLGKPSTTEYDRTKKDYGSKNHGMAGSVITRRIFFDEEINLREKVCYMVRRHMVLHHIFDDEKKAEKQLIALSNGFVSVEQMVILNMCDSLGSRNDIETSEHVSERINKIRNLALSLGCLNNRYKEPKKKENGDFTMYVMIGVPGAGKSYYVDRHFKGRYPIISRDIIRNEIGLKGEKTLGNKSQEDKVTNIFNKRLIECCENKRTFVIDNTNVRKKYREEYKELAKEYNPRVVYVYVEGPSLRTIKKRRDGMMPLDVIDRMWENFDFPEYGECDVLIIEKQKEKLIKKILKKILPFKTK